MLHAASLSNERIEFLMLATERHRQRKVVPGQQDSLEQNNVAINPHEVHPITPTALTPPSISGTTNKHYSSGYLDDSTSENDIDWNLFINTADVYKVDQGSDGFWSTALTETSPFTATGNVSATDPEVYKDQLQICIPDGYTGSYENGSTQGGATVLHRAVQTGNSKVTRLLLEHNADCDSKDSAGLTPLSCAVIGGNEEILELLLSHGAGISHIDNAHQSALHWAVLHKRHKILEKLLKRCSGDLALLNSRNKDGETPLSIAVSAGNEVAVKLLLDSGATVNVN